MKESYSYWGLIIYNYYNIKKYDLSYFGKGYIKKDLKRGIIRGGGVDKNFRGKYEILKRLEIIVFDRKLI